MASPARARKLKMAKFVKNQTNLVKTEEEHLPASTHPETQKKNYRVQKRVLHKSKNRPNDIYLGENSNLKSQLEKCKQLLDTKFNELFLHGLGAAIPRAMNIADELKSFYKGTIDYTLTTSTVKLVDDLIPLDEETPPSFRTRNVGSVDIHVFRTVKIPGLN